MKHVVLIGQAPPKKPSSVPFGRTRLYQWLSEVGVTKKEALIHFSFTALVDKFPGITGNSHKSPTTQEILNSKPKLIEFMQNKCPEIIVPVGTLAIKEVLASENLLLTNVIGKKFFLDPFSSLGYRIPIIPLPHPSAASSWIYLDDHGDLLRRALALLKYELRR